MKLFKTINQIGLISVLSLAVSCGPGSTGGSSNKPGAGLPIDPLNPIKKTYQNPGQLLGPDMVDLGRAKNFVILAKSAITTVPNSAITGDLGISPAAASDMQDFSLMADASNTFSTSDQVTGKIFAADYSSPTSNNLTLSVLDMQAAYTDAVGRPTPDFSELMDGDISGLTLAPALYKWGGSVVINSDVYLSGGANDVFIFQIAGGIVMAPGVKIILQGAINPKNIFWAAGESVIIDVGAHFEGVILAQTDIALKTGASIKGRLLAQTAVTLDQAVVTQPAE